MEAAWRLDVVGNNMGYEIYNLKRVQGCQFSFKAMKEWCGRSVS